MYILYLDDSGSPANQNEEYFVLGGVVIHENFIHIISEKIEDVANFVNPGDAGRVEFHSSDIWGAREHPWNKDNKDERKQIFRRVYETMKHSKQNLVAFACAIHKASYPGSDVLLMAYEDLCSRFDLFINRKNNDDKRYSHQGIIVFDEHSYMNLLQAQTMNMMPFGQKVKSKTLGDESPKPPLFF